MATRHLIRANVKRARVFCLIVSKRLFAEKRKRDRRAEKWRKSHCLVVAGNDRAEGDKLGKGERPQDAEGDPVRRSRRRITRSSLNRRSKVSTPRENGR